MKEIQTTAEHPLAYYQTDPADCTNESLLRVSELRVDPRNACDAALCAIGMNEVHRQSWTARFIETGLQPPEMIYDVMHSPQDIVRHAQQPHSRYLVTALGREPIGDPEEVRAFARVERYRPRVPTTDNWFRQRYPTIVDLETPNGRLETGEYHVDALALARHALLGSNGRHKAAACTEVQNPDAVSFYESLGLKPVAYPIEIIGSNGVPDQFKLSFMEYAHMEVPHAAEAQGVLQQTLTPYMPR